MGRADYLAPGDWNSMCYRCGHKFKASMLERYWAGYWLCGRCWNPRQPQDFVRALPDKMTPPWAQPWPADDYEFGDEIVTESSDLLLGPLIYIVTETDQSPLTTET